MACFGFKDLNQKYLQGLEVLVWFHVLFTFGVITKAFFPSNSILFIRPAPVRLSTICLV